MAQFTSIEALKKYLITSQILRLDQWQMIEGEFESDSVADALKLMERRQLLTNLQAQRIAKGNTDGLVLGNYKLLYKNASGSL